MRRKKLFKYEILVEVIMKDGDLGHNVAQVYKFPKMRTVPSFF